MTSEEKIIAIALSLVLIVLGTGFIVQQLLDAGEAKCEARVAAANEALQVKTDALAKQFQGELSDAEIAHQAELDRIKSDALQPINAGGVRYVASPVSR